VSALGIQYAFADYLTRVDQATAQGVLGVAIGTLLRNTVAVVGVTLVSAFIIEGVLPVLTGGPNLTSWLPSGALREITSSHTEIGQLAPAAAAALLLAYPAALITATLVLDRAKSSYPRGPGVHGVYPADVIGMVDSVIAPAPPS
jgi:hypothetical protein